MTPNKLNNINNNIYISINYMHKMNMQKVSLKEIKEYIYTYKVYLIPLCKSLAYLYQRLL